MKKCFNLIYIIVIFSILVFLATGIFNGNGTMENEKTLEVPQLMKDNSVNRDFLDELDNYVTANIRFRNKIISVNTSISEDVFHTSSVDTVVLGNNGYLYYADTVNDYLGIVTLSEREQYNIVHILELIQEYVNNNNSEFMFVIAPNKNSLYDYMPYNYFKVS